MSAADTSINSVLAGTTATKTTAQTGKKENSTLGKDDFLNLLVTQLKYQDPLKPMDDTQFISQMAQFSSLEQMQNVSTGITGVKAFSYIGKQVTGTVLDDATGKSNPVTGIVESVKLSNGKYLAVVNDQDVPVESITQVDYAIPAGLPAKITDFTGVIGKNATAAFVDADTQQPLDINGNVDALEDINGTVYAVINNADVDLTDAVLTKEEQANYADLKSYLNDKMNKKEPITAVLVRRDSKGNIAERYNVKGILSSYEMDDGGKITSAVMKDIRIPAGNIMTINK